MMDSDDIDDGYSGEEEGLHCLSYEFQSHPQIDESLISHEPADAITGERMTIHLLAECADSVHVAPRQSAARQILEALQVAVTSVEADSEQDDVVKVFAYIRKLSQDNETIVRCNLLSMLPKLASFCAEYDSPLVSLKELIETDVLPIVLKAIADEDKNCNMRVRKEGYSVLKYLLKNNLINPKNVENKISDICRELLFHPNDIINILTAGNFIARMPPIIGEATTEKLLLPKISELCSNQHPKVREACPYFLVDLACFVNSLVTENIIIPLFIKLSEDEAACVRVACAETVVILSCLCLMETRKSILSRIFLSLLVDPEISVNCAACKQLGPFITTFGQPVIMALACNRSGDFLLTHFKGSTFEFSSRHSIFQFYNQPEENIFSIFMLPMNLDEDNMSAVKNNFYDLPSNDENNSLVCNSGSNTADSTHGYLNYNENASTQSLALNQSVDTLSSGSISLVAPEAAKTTELKVNDGEKREEEARNEQYSGNNNVCKVFFPDESECNVRRVKSLNEQLKNQPDVVSSCRRWRGKRNLDHKRELLRYMRDRKEKDYGTCKGNAYESSSESFNSFQFWRDPIPEFDERDIVVNDAVCNKVSPEAHYKSHGELRKKNEGSSMIMSDRSLSFTRASVVTTTTTVVSKQIMLPQLLLDAFICMSDSRLVDYRMHCAYSFPAVSLTLGAYNWFLLKNAYVELAKDPERKIRQTIASSIHEVASIIGPELATQDLMPIYNSLINDLEGVRIVALNHLSCFVKLLKPFGRCQFLPHLTKFMKTDYTWNWRFRQRVSEQLIEIMDLFAPSDCRKFISPVAFSLLFDRVSDVRLQALDLVVNLIRVVSMDVTILRSILAELAEQLAHSTQWARRLSFARLCSLLLKSSVLPDDMFARDVLPHLLDLSWDSVPNVRIAVARTISNYVITYPYFSNIFSPHYDVLTQVLKRLCKDKDRDVRYFASLNASQFEGLQKPFQKADRW